MYSTMWLRAPHLKCVHEMIAWNVHLVREGLLWLRRLVGGAFFGGHLWWPRMFMSRATTFMKLWEPSGLVLLDWKIVRRQKHFKFQTIRGLYAASTIDKQLSTFHRTVFLNVARLWTKGQNNGLFAVSSYELEYVLSVDETQDAASLTTVYSILCMILIKSIREP